MWTRKLAKTSGALLMILISAQSSFAGSKASKLGSCKMSPFATKSGYAHGYQWIDLTDGGKKIEFLFDSKSSKSAKATSVGCASPSKISVPNPTSVIIKTKENTFVSYSFSCPQNDAETIHYTVMVEKSTGRIVMASQTPDHIKFSSIAPLTCRDGETVSKNFMLQHFSFLPGYSRDVADESGIQPSASTSSGSTKNVNEIPMAQVQEAYVPMTATAFQ